VNATVAVLAFAAVPVVAQSPVPANGGWSYYGLANGPHIAPPELRPTVPWRFTHTPAIPTYGPIPVLELRAEHPARPAFGWLGLYRPSPRGTR
jgi:hypothetical protein